MIFGISSGLLSSSLGFLPVPLQFLLPPIIFALALCFAKGKIERASLWIFGGFEFAWVASLLVGLITLTVSGAWFDPYGSTLLGCSCGATGALFVAITYMVHFHKSASNRTLWMTVAVGAVAGCLGLSLEVYLNDHGQNLFAAGSALHGVWQPSVAISLALGEHLDKRLV